MYKWIGRRVTGNSTHALNGLLVWVVIGGPFWLPPDWWAVFVLWCVYTIGIQVLYYTKPAPAWMPRDRWLLWGGG